MLSIIIPCYKEGKIIKSSVNELIYSLKDLKYEIIVVDDNSDDGTLEEITTLASKNKNIQILLNTSAKGFGNSIIEGIKKAKGEFICFVMADQSDDPKDIIRYYNTIISDSYDCVFGDRWAIKGRVYNYPRFKFLFNRFGNKILSFLFKTKYYDITNSFKMYRKDTLIGLFPLISNHFSITVEIPLKIIYRGLKYKVISNSWRNNEHSVSKLNLWNVIYTYNLIIIYCMIEKYFFDQKRKNN